MAETFYAVGNKNKINKIYENDGQPCIYLSKNLADAVALFSNARGYPAIVFEVVLCEKTWFDDVNKNEEDN